MNANDYQREAHKTAEYDGNICYPFLGLAEEAGEVLGKVKKFIRHNKGEKPSPKFYKQDKNLIHIAFLSSQQDLSDDTQLQCSTAEEVRYIKNYDEFLPKLAKELGDVLWYVAEIATVYGLNLSDIMQENLAKLADRKARNVIDGEGDNR